jgi:acetyl-CoA carboxylase biotin carboxyl carrier protein
MNLDEIKQILELMREHELSEFELERDGMSVRLRKGSPPQWPAGMAPLAAATYPAASPSTPPSAPSVTPATVESQVLTAASEDVDLAVIKSPIVGTFYRASEPGAKPLTEVGETVKNGQVICIIEAMKLMNEIKAECDGEVVKVYVENGQAVQYGERLFAIKPA